MTAAAATSTPSPTSSTTNTLSAMQPQPCAKRVTAQALADCGKRLREGNLVSFPTETVYGLGCHALDESACRKVFQAKERPLTDPLIVHVNEAADAFKLWNATADVDSSDTLAPSLEGRVLTTLCNAFWPGPLTLVAVASNAVPSVVMAGTGFVAARSPRHDLARALIDAAQVPLAAPSANKFGHVSPTTAQHVWDDLKYEDVWILEQDEPVHDSSPDKGNNNSCNVGVESSVVKLEMNQDGTQGTLTVLRQGAVSVFDLQTAIKEAGLHESICVVAKSNQRVSEVTATVAPGQTIRHYSPNVPSFLLSPGCVSADYDSVSLKSALKGAVVLDYGRQCEAWRDHVLDYRDLSATRDSAQAAQWIYESLRWAEQIPGASHILFAPLESGDDVVEADALMLAVQDRLMRAASGVVLESLDALAVNGSSPAN